LLSGKIENIIVAHVIKYYRLLTVVQHMWQDQCQTDYLLNIQSNSLKAIVQSAIGSLEHIDATNTQESVA